MKKPALSSAGSVVAGIAKLLGLGRTSLLVVAALTVAFSGAVQAKTNEWTQVPLQGSIQTVLPDGTERTLEPACSGGPVPSQDGPVPAPTDYSFFIQKGNPNRILISFDGGGACWDDATCLLSPLYPDSFGGRSTYVPVVDETTDSLAQYGGILDSENSSNPYHNYTKIFVPYCTGDIHWGSRDTTYSLHTPNGPVDWTIHHRGTDNFLAVLDWLQKNDIDFEEARDVSVAGASAGGYGADLAFAYVAALTNSKARLNLISDSAIGVIDSPDPDYSPLSFYTTAIYNPEAPGTESWGVAQNLPPWVFGEYPEAFLAQGAENLLGFVPSVFAALDHYKPDAKLASLTPNLDQTQIGFYILMKRPPNPGTTEFFEWYGAMIEMTAATTGLSPNYRFFIENSNCHTFIFTDEEFYRVGANGITVADWISAMIKPGTRTWDSVNPYLDPESFHECQPLP